MEWDNFDKNHILYVTNELYRLTLLFPKKEPLRYKMRELSDEVLANFVSLPQADNNPNRIKIIRDSKRLIEILDTFFELVKSQGWVRASEVLNLQEEYSKINEKLIRLKREEKKEKTREEATGKEREEISSLPEPKKLQLEQSSPTFEVKPEISERQKKILEILKIKGRAQVGEMKNVFPNVSKRTLRRDFRKLLKLGLVDRIGEKNNTFYRIRGRTEEV